MVLDAKDEGTLHFDRSQLPTGVCDLIVYDEAGNVLADRLFFVNHHDYDQRRITIEGAKTKYQPCEKADLTLAAPRDVRTLSVAVRDQKGTAPSYDSGSLLTDKAGMVYPGNNLDNTVAHGKALMSAGYAYHSVSADSFDISSARNDSSVFSLTAGFS